MVEDKEILEVEQEQYIWTFPLDQDCVKFYGYTIKFTISVNFFKK